MTVSIRDQKILNEYPKTQPSLQRLGDLPNVASLPVGDMTVNAASMASFVFTYSFAKNGALSTAIALAVKSLPVGSIIDALIMEVITPITQGTAAPILFLIGSSTMGTPTTLQSIPAADFAGAGIKQYMLSSTLVVSNNTINSVGLSTTNATTGGVANFYVSYVNPIQFAK